MRSIRRLPILALLLMACAAQAQAPAGKPETTPENILAQQQQLRTDLQVGSEQYRYVDPFRRRQIYAAQKKVFTLLEGRQALRELNADDQLTVFNALKQIESNLVKANADDRMVCERVALAGTRRYEMVCQTREERDRRANKAVETLMNRPACTTQDCAGG